MTQEKGRRTTPDRTCVFKEMEASRALSLVRTIHRDEIERSVAAAVLDCLPLGVLVLDRDAKILLLNRAAQAILDQGDGLAVLREGLSVARPSEAATFRRLLGEACEGPGTFAGAWGGALPVSRPSGRRSFALLVVPLRSQVTLAPASRAQTAVVFLSDAETELRVADAVLRQLYGLTRAEATVARLLLAGRSVEDIVRELGITSGTARTHVKRILAKAGMRSQRDLIRVLVSGPAWLQSPVEAAEQRT